MKLGIPVRIVFLAATVFLIQGCASSDHLKLSYSSEFSLAVPLSALSDATIFSTEELSLKTGDGYLVSGRVISNASEGLSDNVSMTDYPAFLFGLRPLESLEPEDARLFENSASEIRHTYGDRKPNQETTGEFTAYTICGNGACLGYVVKTDFDDHILMVHALGATREEFTSLINGGLNAER
ncbi:hypothetical protein [Marinobacter zhanjiangensis]|uniref:hypothetical protein n=1 Tax=Marinobacter zhanjiangensis TaxID=578215 RepID=UPI00167BEB94|nr:hypothetical protein [Marinobacter zhanjiangensis]